MANYNLVYFDLRGRGESIRMVLAFTGVKYTEERVTMEGWPEIKSSGRCPFGQLPLLELGNGRVISQSVAILRFLALENGVAPDNAYERARADMIVDSVKDMEDKMAMLYWEKDEQRKAQLNTSIYDDNLPKLMGFLTKILEGNNGGKGYLVGNKISYADINVFGFFNGYLGGGKLEVPEQIKAFPLLVDLYNRVMNEPKILEYLKNRKPNPDWYPY
ncbi:hematopoietic prostaglandin D synthase-like isoform X2 [Actinia tenebrosa]|uniref:Hematopoietic prostaglandin D synthase-like isoform X1 n=1 Tax=Actinia tenebrosa TaxID=6105 RepID=A0A6P8J0A8_ACTTE|nr:hematopoietic prostaglandin D synthase-like isoform X1 [Actinia tenebrosa]XP_031572874.1 hematopoietic prostaglandin D synthase-like isoform X2 [Actinia tenebrosa]